MDERGRSKSVEKGVKDPKPGWPQFSHFEKKGEQQPESHSKEKKDPTRPLMGFHQENQGPDQYVAEAREEREAAFREGISQSRRDVYDRDGELVVVSIDEVSVLFP